MIDKRKRNNRWEGRPTEDSAFSSLDDWSPRKSKKEEKEQREAELKAFHILKHTAPPDNVIHAEFRQLELPLVWWHNVEIWRKPYSVSAVFRPAEDAALTLVKKHAYSLSGLARSYLFPKEREVFLESLRAMQECPRYYTDAMRETWIAKQMKMTSDQVKRYLRKADAIMENMDFEERMKVLKVESNFRELVKEVLREAA